MNDTHTHTFNKLNSRHFTCKTCTNNFEILLTSFFDKMKALDNNLEHIIGVTLFRDTILHPLYDLRYPSQNRSCGNSLFLHNFGDFYNIICMPHKVIMFLYRNMNLNIGYLNFYSHN